MAALLSLPFTGYGHGVSVEATCRSCSQREGAALLPPPPSYCDTDEVWNNLEHTDKGNVLEGQSRKTERASTPITPQSRLVTPTLYVTWARNKLLSF